MKQMLTTEQNEAIEKLRIEYGNLFEVPVKTKKKTYYGFFRPLTLEDYDYFMNQLRKGDSISSEIEMLINIAKRTFVAGDDEMIDEDNHFDIVNSYIRQMYALLDTKYAISDEIDNQVVIKVIDASPSDLDLSKEVLWNTTDKTVSVDNVSYNYFEGKFRKPSFKDYKIYLMVYDSGNIVSAGLELARLCFIEGDKDIIDKHKPSLVYSASKYFTNIIGTYDSSIKKK